MLISNKLSTIPPWTPLPPSPPPPQNENNNQMLPQYTFLLRLSIRLHLHILNLISLASTTFNCLHSHTSMAHSTTNATAKTAVL